MNWPTVLSDEFGVSISDGAVGRWWDSLTKGSNAFRGLDDEEMCEAIVWASDDRNWKRHRKNICLGDIRKWLAINRAQNRLESYEELASCEICNNGILEVWPNLGPVVSRKDCIMNLSVVVPCRCTAGQTMMNSLKDWRSLSVEEKNRIKQLAGLGIEQQSALNEEAESIAADIPETTKQGFRQMAKEQMKQVLAKEEENDYGD